MTSYIQYIIKDQIIIDITHILLFSLVSLWLTQQKFASTIPFIRIYISHRILIWIVIRTQAQERARRCEQRVCRLQEFCTLKGCRVFENRWCHKLEFLILSWNIVQEKVINDLLLDLDVVRVLVMVMSRVRSGLGERV